MPEEVMLPPETAEKDVSQATAAEIMQASIDDALAKSLVKQTFDFYSIFRTNNHDPRWISHDSQYFGYVPPKVWTGTTVPRANLPMSLTFAKVESALPSVMQSLFYTGGDYFQVQAENVAQRDVALKWQDAISYVLEHPNQKFGVTAIIEFMECLRDILLYGNGGVRLVWDPKARCPIIERVDIRDFYIDPATGSPSVDDSRAVIERKLVSIDTVKLWIDSDKRFKQLSTFQLQALSEITTVTTADTTKRMQEAFRAVQFDPGYYNWVPNPAERNVEVLIYTSKTKIIYLVNRHTVIFNEENPYGWYPFSFSTCYPVPGRFYGQSVADVTEGFQRYTEALMNGHLDEVSLALYPPRQVSKDSQMSPANQRWFPGSTIMSDATESKNTLLQPAASLTNVMGDIQMMGSFSDMVSGINGVGMGVPRPGNANRTATGMDMQSQGNTMRLLPIVLAFEMYLFTPLLYKIYEMIKMHTPIDSKIPALSKDKEVYQADAADLIPKKCQFKMLASTRMLNQQALAQIVPFVTQSLLQGPVLQGLNQANMTVDFPEVSRLIQDATGTQKLYQFVRPLNEQEMQAKNAPPPEVIGEQQKSQADLGTRVQLMGMKNESAEKIAAMKNSGGPEEAAAKQQEMQLKLQESAQKLQHKEKEAQLDAMMKQMQLQFEKQLNDAKLQGKQQEISANLQAKQYEAAQKRESAGLDLQIKRAQGDTMVAAAQDKAEMDRASGMQQLSLKQLAADAALKNQNAKAKATSAKKTSKES